MHARSADLRRRLLTKGFTPEPLCPLCRAPQKPLNFSKHTRQCERDLASLTIEATDRKLAELHSTEGRNEDLVEQLRRERFDAHSLLFGFDVAMGNGPMHTDHPDDDSCSF